MAKGLNMNAQQKQQEIVPVAKLAPSRLPITSEVANRLGVSPEEWRVLVDQTFPAAQTVEAVQMAISYCRHRNLDVFKKPVHIVPVYSTALKRMVETVWPGISELRTTASRTKQYAGLTEAEFGPIIEREFVQTIEKEDRTQGEVRRIVKYPEWCRMTAYRMLDGQKCAFTARIFWTENYATAGRFTETPNEMWRKRPHGQIEKCCEAAVLRKAFPEELGNEYAAEEMQGRILDDETVPVAAIPERQRVEPPRPPRPSQPQQDQRSQPNPKTEQKAQPAQNITENITDADYEEMFPGDRPSRETESHEPLDDQGDDGGENTDADFFYQLEAELSECADEDRFNDVWDKFDCFAKFDGNEDAQKICKQIKARQMKRLYGVGGVNG